MIQQRLDASGVVRQYSPPPCLVVRELIREPRAQGHKMHAPGVRIGRRQGRQNILPQLSQRRAIAKIRSSGEAPHLTNLVEMSGQLSQTDRGRHTDMRERDRERELSRKRRDVAKGKRPAQQLAAGGSLPRHKGVHRCGILEVVRAIKVDRRQQMPVERRIDALPGLKTGLLRPERLAGTTRRIADGAPSVVRRRRRGRDVNGGGILIDRLRRQPKRRQQGQRVALELVSTHREAVARPQLVNRE